MEEFLYKLLCWIFSFFIYIFFCCCTSAGYFHYRPYEMTEGNACNRVCSVCLPRCSIFNCGTWWSAVHCTIGYPNMRVSALHHGLWPFFTADPHPRVHAHRPTVVCSSHNCVRPLGIPLNTSSSLPTIDSLTAHPRVHVQRPTVVCSSHNRVWLQGIPLHIPELSPQSIHLQPIPEYMCTDQQLSAADTTMLGCRESPLTRPSSLPTNRFLFVYGNTARYHLIFNVIM